MERLYTFIALGAVALSLAAPAPAGAQQAASPSGSGDQDVVAQQSGDRSKSTVTLPPMLPGSSRSPSASQSAPSGKKSKEKSVKKTPPARPRERTARQAPEPRRPTELHPKWPLQRPPRETIVRRRRHVDRVPPVIFLPPLIFGGIVIEDWGGHYVRDRLSWSDSETLYRDEDWVEIVLDANARGRKLWFEVSGGRIRIEWAEVVFENGETQVVDFSQRSIGPGLYALADFRDGRRVDHVRMVAQAVSRQVTVTLRMEYY